MLAHSGVSEGRASVSDPVSDCVYPSLKSWNYLLPCKCEPCGQCSAVLSCEGEAIIQSG